jgi:Family of unknown function (DUF6349)
VSTDAFPIALQIPKNWQIALCEPETAPGPGCQPTVIARYSRTRDTEYRGACFGCGWIGGSRRDCNLAVEDAHDHAHPGWRELPVVDMPRRTADPRKDREQLARVATELVRLVPPGWPERCGPIRAWRDSPIASRHVPGYSPWGGGEMAVVRDANHGEPAPVLEQLRFTL